MASRGAIATIHSDALKRVEAATAAIAGRLGIAVPPPVPHAKQPELREAWELARQAGFLEAIDHAISGMAASGDAPAGYEALTVALLRERLTEREIEVPSGAKKADLVALLEADDARTVEESDAGDEPPAGDSAPEDGEPGEEPDDAPPTGPTGPDGVTGSTGADTP